jgi:hypothetical protein
MCISARLYRTEAVRSAAPRFWYIFIYMHTYIYIYIYVCEYVWHAYVYISRPRPCHRPAPWLMKATRIHDNKLQAAGLHRGFIACQIITRLESFKNVEMKL